MRPLLHAVRSRSRRRAPRPELPRWSVGAIVKAAVRLTRRRGFSPELFIEANKELEAKADRRPALLQKLCSPSATAN